MKEKKKLLQESINRPTLAASHTSLNAATAFAAWLNGNLTIRVKPSTYESYYRCVTKYVIPFYQEEGNEQLSVQTAMDFSSRINNYQGLSRSYKRKILTIYKTALRELLKDTSEYNTVLNAIFMPRLSGTDVLVLSVREQKLIEMAIVGSNDMKLLGVLLCFYTGIRLGEVCGLKWADIDFEAGTMVVARTVSRVKNFNQTGGKTTLYIGTPKSAHSNRKIPLPGFWIELVKKLKRNSFNDNFFILSDTERPLDPRKYQNLFQTLLKQSGVKSRKFHAIRHTFATRALELGVDIKTLSEILGHSNVSITLNIYAHSMFEQKKKAIEKLNTMYITHTEPTIFAVNNSVVNA
ncbi:tyrosine-type recombinase/integrase [Aminipila butyrica]|uniref:tyrosine-type recombinase/integrase n=1 Tax=Aminipila butyrica TaxID=433296 RepID=UPI002ED1B907